MSREGAGRRRGVRRALQRLLVVPDGGSISERRRAKTILIIATGLIAAAPPTAALAAWLLPNPHVNVSLVIFGLVFYLLVRHLIRQHLVSAAAWCLVGYFAAVPVVGVLTMGRVESSPLFIVLIVIVAASILPPREVALAAGIAFTELGLMFAIDLGLSIDVTTMLAYISVSLMVATAAALVLSLAIDRALASADQARGRAEELADDLRAANAELEQHVSERTTELRKALRREQVLSARLGELSLRDALTGLHNRRHLDDNLHRMFAAARHAGTPFSLAVIDLDNFKAVNDEHTHLVGDDVLRAVARVLLTQVRESDALIRMGGEEFALLMPETSLSDARAACERMREELVQHDWSGLGDGLTVTASFGVATSADHLTGADLLRAADILLYEAKREGRNRVVAQASAAPRQVTAVTDG